MKQKQIEKAILLKKKKKKPDVILNGIIKNVFKASNNKHMRKNKNQLKKKIEMFCG